MSTDNVSSDLIWQITNGNNAYLVKRKQSGVARFSRDPFNLKNISSRKYDGYVNEKAFGIQPRAGGNGLTLTTKVEGKTNQPASSIKKHTYGTSVPARKTYKAIVRATTQQGYRADLREEAVARASALKNAQRVKKDAPRPKSRGKKALSKAAPESS